MAWFGTDGTRGRSFRNNVRSRPWLVGNEGLGVNPARSRDELSTKGDLINQALEVVEDRSGGDDHDLRDTLMRCTGRTMPGLVSDSAVHLIIVRGHTRLDDMLRIKVNSPGRVPLVLPACELEKEWGQAVRRAHSATTAPGLSQQHRRSDSLQSACPAVARGIAILRQRDRTLGPRAEQPDRAAYELTCARRLLVA